MTEHMVRRGEADEDSGEALRDGFRSILAAHPEPPLGDLAGAAVTGGRRLRRRRRVAAATALTTAVVVGAAVITGLVQPAVQPPPVVPAEQPAPDPAPEEQEPETVPRPHRTDTPDEDPQSGSVLPDGAVVPADPSAGAVTEGREDPADDAHGATDTPRASEGHAPD